MIQIACGGDAVEEEISICTLMKYSTRFDLRTANAFHLALTDSIDVWQLGSSD